MSKIRQWAGIFLLITFIIGLVGCFTIRIGGKGELAPSTDKGIKIAEKRVWYALWGFVPLGDNSTDSLIADPVKKVRFETKYTPLDALINIFTIWVSIETFKVEVYEVK